MQRHWLIIPLGFLLIAVGPAYAQGDPEWRSWPMGQRFGVSVGGFFAKLDTKVRLDGSGGVLGTVIDFGRPLRCLPYSGVLQQCRPVEIHGRSGASSVPPELR